MREIKFTPSGFATGKTYVAELLLNSNVVNTINNLVSGTEYTFVVTIPGTYTLRVKQSDDNACLFNRVIQALFPIVTYTTTAVNCDTNTYNFTITLTNPSSAGSDVKYGWSLYDDCSLVTNWSAVNNIVLPADDVSRFVFVKNEVASCCIKIASSQKAACIFCDLTVSNITFSCG